MTTHLRGAARSQGRASDRLIIALDVATMREAGQLVDALATQVTWFKVGSELFTAAGPQAVDLVLTRDRNVFLDLKFHDIPHTVADAVAAAARLGVGMMNLHVAAGDEALRAAVRALDEVAASGRPLTPLTQNHSPGSRPWLLGVTKLTSLDEGQDTLAQVVDAAARAKWSGLDGVIASPREAAAIKAACGPAFVVVTPGIRPTGSADGDQRRTATPADAVRAGADFLVVGRPITQAPDPRAAAARVLEEIDTAIRQETRTPARNP